MEQVEDTKSASVNSIITESITDVNESDFDEAAHNALIGNRESRKQIVEQYGYDTKRLNRIKCRKEDELIEHNYGIDFSKLKESEIEMVNLRKYLVKWQKELNKHVDEGTAPVFGYPPICYSPTGYGEQVKQNSKQEYLRTLMRHVFRKNNSLPSVANIIDAKENEDAFFDDL